MNEQRLIEGKLYDVPEQEQIPERTQILVELAHRLHDLHELDPSCAIAFIQLMGKLYRIDPWVYHLTLTILAGNQDAGKSLNVKAASKLHRKQHEHQQQNRALNLLELYYPRVASVIREIIGRKKPQRTA